MDVALDRGFGGADNPAPAQPAQDSHDLIVELVGAAMNDLFLDGAVEPLGDAVGLGLLDEDAAGGETPELDPIGEMVGQVLEPWSIRRASPGRHRDRLKRRAINQTLRPDHHPADHHLDASAWTTVDEGGRGGEDGVDPGLELVERHRLDQIAVGGEVLGRHHGVGTGVGG